MTNTTQETATGHVEHLDPNALIIEANVRPGEMMKPLTREFVATIRDHGVMEPVIGYRDDQGNTIVRAGQRRTLGAREAGVATIPVYLVDGDSTDTAKRIVEQLIENDQRTDLTDAQRAEAWQQLAFEGLSVATIAKRTGTKQARVKAGLAVVDNGTAASAIVAHDLTLDQAATLIEFDGDDDTVNALIEVATTDPAQFVHAVQRARDDRDRAQIKATTEAQLTELGYTILDERPWYSDSGYTSINYAVNGDGNRVTVEEVDQAPGRAAFVQVYSSGEAEISRYVTDLKAAGFRDGNSSTGTASGPMTDEQKAERRTLIGNNKAWASAEVVRREWLTAFLAKKTLPKDATRFAVTALTDHRHTVGSAIGNNNAMAHTLLGLSVDGQWSPDKLGDIVEKNPTKAAHITLAVAIGGIEASTSKNTWRSPEPRMARYFEQLAAWGYGLSDVEQIVTAARASTARTGFEEGEQVEDDDDPMTEH